MVEIEYDGVNQNIEYEKTIRQVIEVCFYTENLLDKNVEMNIILTTPDKIRIINKEYRNIDKATDVLSFPMFEKNEIVEIQKNGSKVKEVLGDIVISIEQVAKQAEEYGHSFQRELSYMVVHGFYHCMGYDHIEKEEQKKMREKEENVLNKVGLKRE